MFTFQNCKFIRVQYLTEKKEKGECKMQKSVSKDFLSAIFILKYSYQIRLLSIKDLQGMLIN